MAGLSGGELFLFGVVVGMIVTLIIVLCQVTLVERSKRIVSGNRKDP